MGVEMIKDRYGEDQLVLSNEDFYNDDVMGDRFSSYDIMKKIKSTKTFVAKVMSKKNSKIYVLKQLRNDQSKEKAIQEFQILSKLNHPNIIKYFKMFNEDGKIYFVKEYVDNGSLKNIKEAYNSINKPIEVNTLWNIFMQCLAGLDYLHNNNIIHKNISLNNILMNENKVIKIDDIQFNQDPKEKSDDIREMGFVFRQLIPTNFQNRYPQEMIYIIQEMENNYKKQNSSKLLNEIMKHYIKSVAKVSSINAIFRCMSSFQVFYHQMRQNQLSFSENNTPVAFYYSKCLNTYLNQSGNPKDVIIFYNNFRNLLYKNSQVNNDVEIRPRQVLEFLLERLNRETGSNFQGASFSTQIMIFDEKRELAYQKFEDYFNKNFTSIISKYFVGKIKTKRLCNKCEGYVYSFNIHPFIEFDMEMSNVVRKDANGNIIDLNELANWFRAQNAQKKVLSPEHKITCRFPQCNNQVTEHREFKQFHHLNQCLIISFNRGKNYNNTFEPKIPSILDLNYYLAQNAPYKTYSLVGLVRRFVDENQEEHFIAIYRDMQANVWRISDREKVEIIKDPFSYKNGLVILVFYSAIIKIGQ